MSMPRDQQNRRPSVGLVGLGLLGSALARRLIHRGYSVWGFDADPAAMGRFADAGGCAVSRPGDVVIADNPVILCLPDSDVVERVLQQLVPRCRAQTLLIDTTTGTPQKTQQMAATLLPAGIELIDASVLGSSRQAEDGDAVLMVGASRPAFHRCQSLLKQISENVIRVGEVGSGQQMKLVANLVLGLNRAVLAEGLQFAKKQGLNLHAVLEVLKAGAAYSRVMDTKALKMISEDFNPQARLNQHLKDVRLILDQAEQSRKSICRFLNCIETCWNASARWDTVTRTTVPSFEHGNKRDADIISCLVSVRRQSLANRNRMLAAAVRFRSRPPQRMATSRAGDFR
ncbi:MAG: NAD(P)-dependent oxidoreductase [Planctomycetaceae bacterium]